ncbi:hypothetical protein [Microbulbifer guangxiensis]|uniref:hypothetical protein n=1 Tax=Microbulbifer guangxiensis TaxID=2904249 RepID=UPI001F37368C|nr:hypothetical protein [Microbulbifer guangxiensis]
MRKKAEYLFDNPRNVRWLLRGFYACCLVLFILEFLVHRHTERAWEQLPGFYPLYGFVGCVLLVLIAKWMRGLLMRPENYYETLDSADKQPDSGADHSPAEVEH